jgi:Uma2 family endonuclease
MSSDLIKTRRWTRAEYDRLTEIGIFHAGEPLELLAGRLVVAEPQHRPHAVAIGLVTEALRLAFGPGWHVQVQAPIALDRRSEPEPDLAVVRGVPRDYPRDHPAHPALVVEVADASLRLDRRLKGRLYARSRVPEYWIVNLVDRVLEVYRAPERQGVRWKYVDVQILGPEASISPLGSPASRVAVVDLLP